MRFLIGTLAIAMLIGASAAQAGDRQTFIIANNSDGYGIDRCLANGHSCGAAAAAAYCKSREFGQALSFRKVDKDDITGAVPTSSQACHGGSCDEFVAITCSR
jgi:hypothetical protein